MRRNAQNATQSPLRAVLKFVALNLSLSLSLPLFLPFLHHRSICTVALSLLPLHTAHSRLIYVEIAVDAHWMRPFFSPSPAHGHRIDSFFSSYFSSIFFFFITIFCFKILIFVISSFFRSLRKIRPSWQLLNASLILQKTRRPM